jgi:hypothetical protein
MMLSLGGRGKSNGCTAVGRSFCQIACCKPTWRKRRLYVSLPINKK